MKRIFHFSKIVFACLLIFYNFPSCRTSQRETTILTPEVITITNGNTGNGDLGMEYHFGQRADTVSAEKGQIISWHIGGNPASTVKSITGIDKKGDSKNLFRVLPHKEATSNDWTGTIKKHVKWGRHEDYYIQWIDKTGKPQTYDPRIQIKSK